MRIKKKKKKETLKKQYGKFPSLFIPQSTRLKSLRFNLPGVITNIGTISSNGKTTVARFIFFSIQKDLNNQYAKIDIELVSNPKNDQKKNIVSLLLFVQRIKLKVTQVIKVKIKPSKYFFEGDLLLEKPIKKRLINDTAIDVMCE